MQEEKKYAIGIDIGTSSVKVIVAVAKDDGEFSVVAETKRAMHGMRKGGIVNPSAVAADIDNALIEAQKISGVYISSASVSINGSHIIGGSASGAVSISASVVTIDDLARVEDTVRSLNLPANRTILDALPQEYIMDGTVRVKNPIDMGGTRLEMSAYITTALTPHLNVLMQTLKQANLQPRNIEIAGLAAAKAVLSDEQKERGVVLVDIGAATTNVVVYEDGDLIHVSVLPVGGDNITNDLATVLMIDWDIAEELKKNLAFAVRDLRDCPDPIKIRFENEDEIIVDSGKVDMIVEARVESIFELVNDELKKIDRYMKLPGGVILSGGTANLAGIIENAKRTMHLNTKITQQSKLIGLSDSVMNTEFNTCAGLVLIDAENCPVFEQKNQSKIKKIFGWKK